jgi:hypothetical protein
LLSGVSPHKITFLSSGLRFGINQDVLRSSHEREAVPQASDGDPTASDRGTPNDVLLRSKPPGAGSGAGVVGAVAVCRGGRYGSVVVVEHGGSRGVLRWLGMHGMGQKGLSGMMLKRNSADYG